MFAIETKNLSKRYGGAEKLAVNKLNLKINIGEVYGFLGPNGAGKSTTIRLLLNFIQPTNGTATILGKDIVRDSVDIKRSIGYLAGEIALYPKMTGRQFLNYMSDLQPIHSHGKKNDLIDRFQFRSSLDIKIRNLSKGNRQKIGIIQAFMANPKILVLDEPTVGLDPLMQQEFFKLLRETKQRDGSVFVSSHNLAEVQKMCDRIGFIREGKLISEQKIAEVAATAARTFDLVFATPLRQADLKVVPGGRVEMISPTHATVIMHGELKPLFKALAKHDVIQINQREIDLGEEFMHFYASGGKK